MDFIELTVYRDKVPLHVRPDAVKAVIGARKTADHPTCYVVLVGAAESILVVGTVAEVLAKLAPPAPKQPRTRKK